MKKLLTSMLAASLVLLAAGAVQAQEQDLIFVLQNDSALQLTDQELVLVITDDAGTLGEIGTLLGAAAPGMTHGAQANSSFSMEGLCLCTRSISAQIVGMEMPTGATLHIQMGIPVLGDLLSAWVPLSAASSTQVLTGIDSLLSSLSGTLNYVVTLDVEAEGLDLSGETLLAGAEDEIRFGRTVQFTVTEN